MDVPNVVGQRRMTCVNDIIPCLGMLGGTLRRRERVKRRLARKGRRRRNKFRWAPLYLWWSSAFLYAFDHKFDVMLLDFWWSNWWLGRGVCYFCFYIYFSVTERWDTFLGWLGGGFLMTVPLRCLSVPFEESLRRVGSLAVSTCRGDIGTNSYNKHSLYFIKKVIVHCTSWVITKNLIEYDPLEILHNSCMTTLPHIL